MQGAAKNMTNDDLAFFGRVSASISHELKNILAIISEAAGLLGDLTEMAASGEDVRLEMLQSCSRDIVDEVRRGFVTIKQMNTFAHSVDDPVKAIDVSDCLELMIGLAGFLSYACRVHYQAPEMKLPEIFTSPFKLQNVIYRTLVFAFKSVGPDGEINLSVHPEEGDAARIRFSGIGAKSSEPFPTGAVQSLAASIGAELKLDDHRQAIDILIPSLEGAVR